MEIDADYLSPLNAIKLFAWNRNEDWYSGHPFGPLRIKALLELFRHSQTYFMLLGRSGSDLTEEEIKSKNSTNPVVDGAHLFERRILNDAANME